MKLIERLRALLADEFKNCFDKKNYGNRRWARRSVIEYSGGDVSIEDLIADENVITFLMQDI
jgi:DNA gyrase subunit A